jgi:hypothetical protein
MNFISYIETSNRQFGFKKKLSCNHAIYTVRKVINFYTRRQSTVNIGVIDLKKAFDKVNIHSLLCTLQNLKVNSYIILLLENWLTKCAARVKWQGVMSEYISLSAGVRQGGILSPFLFSIYVDCVLNKLAECNKGCRFNLQCFNSFMYADDLILLSSTVSDLQDMLKICESSFLDLDLPINSVKSKCMRVGPRFDKPCSKLLLGGQQLDWVNEIEYLGVTLCANSKFKCTWDKSKKKFYRSCNAILSKLSKIDSIDIALKLIDSQVIPHLTYGIASTSLSKAEISNFSFMYNSIFVKLFKIKHINNIKQCQFYCNFLPFEMLYDYFRCIFLNKLIGSSFLIETSVIDIDDYADLKDILLKYNLINKFNHGKLSNSFVKNSIWRKCTT